MAFLDLVAVALALLFHFTKGDVVGTCRGTPNFERCNRIPGPMKMQPVCFQEQCIVPNAYHGEYTILAKYATDDSASGQYPVDEMWIRGSGPMLSWDLPLRMNRTNSYTWQRTFRFTWDPRAAVCAKPEHCSFLQQSVEFRLYLDEHGNKQMQGANFFHRLPLSSSPQRSDLNEISVYPWFYVVQTKIGDELRLEKLPMFPDTLLRKSPRIYYPASFVENTLKKYRLVILFMELNTDYGMIRPLINHVKATDGSLEECFVAVLPHLSELVPYLAPHHRCLDQAHCEGSCLGCLDEQRRDACQPHTFRQELRTCTYTSLQGLAAGEYLQFLEQYLLPLLTYRLRGRLLDVTLNKVTIVGYKHSGLFACYAGLMRPDIFRNVACLSPSFYLGIDNYSPQFEFKDFLSKLVREVANDTKRANLYRAQNYYLDIGELDDFHFPLANSRETMNEVVSELEKLGLRKDQQIVTQIYPGHSAYQGTIRSDRHNESAFMQRMVYALLNFHRSPGIASGHTKSLAISQSHFVDWEIELDRRLNEGSRGSVPDLRSRQGGSASTSGGSGKNSTFDDCSAVVISHGAYLGTLAVVVIVSAVTTGLLFYIREANRNLGKKKKQKATAREERELNSESSMDSDSSDLSSD